MTNFEIIKKISKYAGIYETDEQLFFETLTRKMFDEFNVGDKLKVDNIGFLHLKNIKASENEKLVKGIVFSENAETSKNNNIFFLSNITEILHPDDFCFSFSIKKMEIPLGDEIDMGFFIPPSGKELLSYIDAKVENLIGDCEIYRGSSRENEVFEVRTEMPGIKIIENLEDKSIPVKEDKVERTIDSGKFQKIDSVISNINEEEEKTEADEEDVNEPAEGIKFTDKPIIVVKEKEAEISENDLDNGRFNRVKSLTDIEKENVEELKEKEYEVPIEHELNPDDLDDSVDEEKITVEKKLNEKIKNENRKTKVFAFVIILILIAASIYFIFLHKPQSVDRSLNVAILPASNPVLIERSYDIPVDYPYKAGEKDLIFDGIDPAILTLSNKNIVSNSNNRENVTNKPAEKSESENGIPTVEPGAYKELGDYIFTDGKTYFVQVSSWKYQSSAENHVKKLKDEGYNASIEKVISQNGNVYYRVKVGNFKSLEEAQKFVNNK